MDALKELFRDLARSYARRDYAAVAGRHDAPGALYLEEDVLIWTDRTRLTSFLEFHCRTNRQLGICHVEPELVTRTIGTGQHFSAWIRWRHYDALGDEVFVMPARYYCRRTETGLLMIQLVEIPERPVAYLGDEIALPLRRPTGGAFRGLALLH